MEKILISDIQTCNNDIYGEWINKDYTCEHYPIKHIIINNFLNDDVYNLIQQEYPENIDQSWWKYENPLEVKFTNDKINTYSSNIKNLFYSLSNDKIINKIGKIFNIDNLEYDPYCHGAGLHIMPRNGRLNMHLDYEKHPIIDKQRRLNIILYLNDDWNEDWNGATELWDEKMEKCVIKSYPKKNTAILFVTNENSWHGVPERILCPKNVNRKTIAFYYVSDIINKASKSKLGSNSNGFREKAVFVKRPQESYDERMEKLYKIRPYRLISENDIKEIYPEWSCDKYFDT
jgi:Rps23 Pro-64 3,4-dihydroxylase Tpa1-like proline 4-hydroxylase